MRDRQLSILYRGQLSSCNYSCAYCPFAKRRDPSDVLAEDRADLERFVEWVVAQPARLSVLFTPWGEALTRHWYRDAMTELSRSPNVDRVAAQTNLSWATDWLDAVDRRTFALWCTYHPTEITVDRFLAKVSVLAELGIRHSVGVVGLPEHHEAAKQLRRELPPTTYLWINAAKTQVGEYTDDEIQAWSEIDPLFAVNTRRYRSHGLPCSGGETMISVAGDGSARPCHFTETSLGSIYDDGFWDRLGPSLCPEQSCGCHIGYVHLKPLKLDRTFGDGILERIPAGWPDPPRT